MTSPTVFGSARWHEMARMLEFETTHAEDPDDKAALERAAKYIRRLGDKDAEAEEAARRETRARMPPRGRTGRS